MGNWQTEEIIKQALKREEAKDSYGRPNGRPVKRKADKLALPMAKIVEHVGELAQERAAARVTTVLQDVDRIIDHRIDEVVMSSLGFERSFDELRVKSGHNDESKPVFRRIQQRAEAALGSQLEGWVDELLKKPAVVKSIKAALEREITDAVTKRLGQLVTSHAEEVAEKIMLKAAKEVDATIDVDGLAAKMPAAMDEAIVDISKE